MKWVGEEGVEHDAFGGREIVARSAENLKIAGTELGKDLAAGTARIGDVRTGGDDGKCGEIARPVAYGGKEGDPFSTHGEAEGGVLNVTPGPHPPVRRTQGGADRITGVRGTRLPGGIPCKPQQFVVRRGHEASLHARHKAPNRRLIAGSLRPTTSVTSSWLSRLSPMPVA